MRHQVKPNRWSCMVTSFAMALGVTIQDLIGLIGHDGSEVAFPHLDEPTRRRGFHQQECIRAAWNLGFSVTPIEAYPVIASADGSQNCVVAFGDQNWDSFNRFIRTTRGVLCCRTKKCHHAMAYDHGVVLDPDDENGVFKYSLSAFLVKGLHPYKLFVVKRWTTGNGTRTSAGG